MEFKPPNYTQLPNEFFEEMLQHLSPMETKVLLVIMRKTFGWKKMRDRISISQLEQYTGSRRQAILKAIKSLISKKIIIKQIEGKKGEQQTFYEIVVEDSNKFYQCDSNTPPQNSNKFYQCDEHTTPSVIFTPTKETLTKEKKKENKEKKFGQSAEASDLCSFFLSKIKENKSNFTKQVTPSWIKSCEKLLKIRSHEELKKIITFSLDHDFWMSKCMSPEKILLHLDALEVEMSKKNTNKNFKERIHQANVEENKKIALQIYKKFPEQIKNSHINLGQNYIEFILGPSNVSNIKFSDFGFKDQVFNMLRKMRLDVNKIMSP